MRLPLALATALFLAGCGTITYNIRSSPIAAGSDAVIKAEINEGQKQTALEIAIVNLPPPDRVQAEATVFVAWQRKDQTSQWSRLGLLDYDADARSGGIKATAPEIAFDFEITAEKTGDASSPSADVVFSQRVSQDTAP